MRSAKFEGTNQKLSPRLGESLSFLFFRGGAITVTNGVIILQPPPMNIRVVTKW